jgi:hypothetical protein
MKTLIHILGPGASGKSTLSRAILEGDIKASPLNIPYIGEIKETVPCTVRGVPGTEKVTYCWSSNGTALAGNSKNGTDSIKAIDALPAVLELCWSKAPVAIVDPVRSSMKFVDWMMAYPEPLTAMFVYLDVSVETNVQRLINRRYKNALAKAKEPWEKDDVVLEESLPQKTLDNMMAFRDRAQGVWKYACDHYTRFPRLCLAIPERLSPWESARAIHSALDYLRNGGGVIKDAQ